VALAILALPISAHAVELGFDIRIALSRQASAELARKGESLVAYASYYGDPRRGAEKHADEVGQIDLNPEDEQVDIPDLDNAHAHISGSTVSAGRLAWIDGPVKVNVNIASARKSGPDNLLACDFIDGPVHVLQNAVVTLHCGLISENASTRLVP